MRHDSRPASFARKGYPVSASDQSGSGRTPGGPALPDHRGVPPNYYTHQHICTRLPTLRMPVGVATDEGLVHLCITTDEASRAVYAQPGAW